LLADSSSPSRRSGGQSFSRLACSKPNAIHTIMPMTAKTTGISITRSNTPMSLPLDQRLRLPVPLRPGLRVSGRRAVGDVLPCPGQAASWGAADAEAGRPGREGDGLLALADGRLDALDVADDARRVAGLDGHDLYRVLAALGGEPLRLHLVEPRWIGILGEERAVDAGED